MLTKLIEKLKAERKTIVFPEGTDYRILEAAARLIADDLLDVILIGEESEVKAAAEKDGRDISVYLWNNKTQQPYSQVIKFTDNWENTKKMWFVGTFF